MFSIEKKKFTKLGRLYIIGLSAIALSVIISQFIIRNSLNDRQNDSTLINIAGKQQMLSQKLTKEVLLIQYKGTSEQKVQFADQLSHTLKLWQSFHDNLLNGSGSLHFLDDNSNEVIALFTKTTPYYEKISKATEYIIKEVQTNPSLSFSVLYSQVETIKHNEGPYLNLMSQIVYQYNRETQEKVSHLKRIELFLMSFTLLVLLIVFLVIFWPTAKTINHTISRLRASEKKAIQMARNANLLKNSKEKTIQELSELTKAIDKTLLFARVTSSGAILHLGDKFLKQFNLSKLPNWTTFPEVISTHKNQQQNIRTLLASHSITGWQGEIEATTPSSETIWLEMHMIPFFSSSNQDEIIIISSDITTRKKAHIEVEELLKKNFEEKMNQQKIISRKIIENQEKEQSRIAKDIHDGIGQMLTGLKFNIESIDLKKNEETAEKVEQLKTRTADIIQGVRTATFNLTPPELSDYGITSALSKLIHELSRLTSQNITFFNKSDFDLRLDPTSEINIYRIVQEAINNAIKYAQASYIIITLSHSDNILSITIDDDGVGFIPQKEEHKKEYGGMGMMFMQERIKYVKGRIFINSMLDKGTKITLNIPIK